MTKDSQRSDMNMMKRQCTESGDGEFGGRQPTASVYKRRIFDENNAVDE